MPKQLVAALLLLVAPVLLHADQASELDRRILSAIQSSYNFRTILADEVQARSKDGVVTLLGSVADADHRALAEETVRNLPGVIGVRNQITVGPASPEHSDGWIGTQIRTKLLLKSNVSLADTSVEVKDGAVTLTGKAANPAQKELITAYAREVEGVKSVNNFIEVLSVEGVPAAPADQVDDASITAQVKYALLTHGSTSALKTAVGTKDGVVTIEGVANSAAEKDLVSHLAGDVRGVRTVVNTMLVKE